MDDPTLTIIRQRQWTHDELHAAGFRYFQRKKQVVLVRELPASEAPKVIKLDWDTLIAEAGSMICYEAGDLLYTNLDDYYHWPVHPDIFRRNYAPWSQPRWIPTPGQIRLMALGCKPFYKFGGAWAKRMTKEGVIQSLESVKPSIVPVGGWLLIGSEGEPWSTSDSEFRSRYVISPVIKLIEFFTLQNKLAISKQ
ncbi:MAG: hypothetical protein ABI947_07485 [Chloroflexota bacterium]